MKQLKFKAFDKKTKKTYLVDEITFFPQANSIKGLVWVRLVEDILKLEFITRHADDVILLEYTNMKDFYGTEIYEGDIVEYYSMNGYNQVKCLKREVYWDSSKGGWNVKGNGVGRLSSSWINEITKLKVVGNIHD